MTEDQRIVVIAEKPDSARKIAEALSRTKESEDKNSGIIDVPDAFDGNHYLVFSAIGHLYELSDPQMNRGIFPIYDIGWFPKGQASRNNFSRDKSRLQYLFRTRIACISRISQGIQKFVNACDFDIEGETIGFNTLEYACHGKGRSSFRAKFSTLTSEDIRQAFASLAPASTKFAKAGQMRHFADYLWGINLSRALTSAANRSKKTQRFVNMSIGRVQGPSLAFVVDREIERMVHVPIPTWEVTCELKKNDFRFEARYRDSPIRIETKATSVYESTLASKFARVLSVDRSLVKLPPRYPFNLGDLQRECYRFFHFPPSVTLAIAERLYLQALISYPRTDSQKLPQRIRPDSILRRLTSLPPIGTLVEELISNPKKRSVPWQGPRDDPAHPAIFPTGQTPKRSLSDAEQKVFEIIVRRFCNTFAPDAILEKTVGVFDVSMNEFQAEGTRVLEVGWMKFYTYSSLIPDPLNVAPSTGEELEVDSAAIDLKFNPQPSRYSEGSLLAKMEDEKIGTKATRAETISTLIKRLYVKKTKNELVPTTNGLSMIETLRNHSPDILSTEMTRNLETKLELLQSSESTEQEIAEQILSSLRSSMKNLRKVENLDWTDLTLSSESTNLKGSLGSCPTCKTGKLQLIRSVKTGKRFIGCSNFAKGCRTSSPAPPRGQIRSTGRLCPSCGWPNIFFTFSRSTKRIESCANFFCSSRKKHESVIPTNSRR